MVNAAVRSEICGPVLPVYLSGKKDSWEGFSGYAYPGISLGVLQEDIVLRLVLLDQVVLKQKSIRLAVHYRELGIRYLGDKDAGLDVQPVRTDKVLGHSLVEILCLTHIDNLPVCVIIPVNARGMWKKLDFLLYIHRSKI